MRDDDRPSCPDCDTPAQGHAGHGRWVCGLCEKGFPAPDLTGAGERALSDFAEIEAYWHDPAPFEAERREGQARMDALFQPWQERRRIEQEARWAKELQA